MSLNSEIKFKIDSLSLLFKCCVKICGSNYVIIYLSSLSNSKSLVLKLKEIFSFAFIICMLQKLFLDCIIQSGTKTPGAICFFKHNLGWVNGTCIVALIEYL